MAGKIGSRHTARRTGTAGKHSRQTLRPAQASQQTATSWPASQQKQQLPQSWPASRRAVQVGGGSAVATGSQEGGCRPTYTVPTPPIAFACPVPTHSLNLYKPNLAPN